MTKLSLVPANASAPRSGTTYDVGPQMVVVIGRELGCDIQIDEAQDMVSRRHLTLRMEGEQILAVDSSSNGLFVNGERVAGLRVVEDEDMLQLGPNGPMFALALEPKPVKKPPPAKATRLYTPVAPAAAAANVPQTRPEPVHVRPVVSAPASQQAVEPQSNSRSPAGGAAVSASSTDGATAYLDKAQDSVMQAHGWLTQVFTHPVVFVVVYLFFMLLTYYLPYVGSNSGVAALAHAAAETVNKPFWAHLSSLAMLVAATWYRGSVIGKSWIMIFPIIAAVFDMAPLLNWIPLVPTAMHLAALIMGVRGRTG